MIAKRSALSPTLIESELFGHRRVAFTGALEDHGGRLETCGRFGTVFLDEIGETGLHIQVKLLRVLEPRRFHRLGETEPRRFDGKLILFLCRRIANCCRPFAADHSPQMHSCGATAPRYMHRRGTIRRPHVGWGWTDER